MAAKVARWQPGGDQEVRWLPRGWCQPRGHQAVVKRPPSSRQDVAKSGGHLATSWLLLLGHFHAAAFWLAATGRSAPLPGHHLAVTWPPLGCCLPAFWVTMMTYVVAKRVVASQAASQEVARWQPAKRQPGGGQPGGGQVRGGQVAKRQPRASQAVAKRQPGGSQEEASQEAAMWRPRGRLSHILPLALVGSLPLFGGLWACTNLVAAT